MPRRVHSDDAIEALEGAGFAASYHPQHREGVLATSLAGSAVASA